jgi:ABC-type multidrug transport system ATPase subunit
VSTVLSVEKLSKRYGSVQALQDVSFEVPKGSVYGLLGPNGSGKTTALGIVSGVLNPGSGTYHWFGQPASAASVRQRIGTLLETPNFYPYLSAYRNLTIPAQIKGVPESDINRVLALTGLEQRKNSSFKGFSLGMKQRLALASTLLGDPEVLVLDEPTNGLDPQGIVEVRELIGRIAEAGKTILIASHLLDEVEKVCTHVAVLQRGQLKAVGPVHNILNSEDQVILRAEDLAQLEHALDMLYPHVKRRQIRQEIAMVMPQNVSPAQLNRALMEKGVSLSHLTLQKKSLESQFMEIIAQPA